MTTPTPTDINVRIVTNLLYQKLFGADAATLRQRLGLPAEDTADDDNLRDHMGELALLFLAEAESEMTLLLKAAPLTGVDLWLRAQQVGGWWGTLLQRMARERGVDPLTGEPVN